MREIGQKEKMKDSYREWPLFTNIRERDEFKKVYNDIYGEPYECIEIRPINWTDIIQESLELSKTIPPQSESVESEKDLNNKSNGTGDEVGENSNP